MTKELLNELLCASNYSVIGVLPEDDGDKAAGSISFLIQSHVLPVIDESTPLPEVTATVTQQIRVSNVEPLIKRSTH